MDITISLHTGKHLEYCHYILNRIYNDFDKSTSSQLIQKSFKQIEKLFIFNLSIYRYVYIE